VQRAKRLIDTTDLPMTEIALSAGFGSLRRFNTVFAAVYKRPPTAIRRLQRPLQPPRGPAPRTSATLKPPQASGSVVAAIRFGEGGA
jgi:AraC-like DNA-binding protein